MNFEPVELLFRRMGLGKVDAKVYITLLTSGPLTTPQLVDELGLHKPQVHTALKRLSSKGLVEVRKGKPAYYRAVSPAILEKIYRDEFDTILHECLKVLSNLQPREVVSKYGVWVFRSFKGLMIKFKETIKNAEIDLAICGDPVFINNIKDDIEDARGRGVNIYIIVYEVPGLHIDEKKLPRISKIKKAVSGDLLVVADSKIAILTQRRFGPSVEPDYGLTIEEPVLVDYLLHDFFNRWLRSKVIRDKPLSLPTKYTIFRLALHEADRILKAGRKIYGVFQGRWVEKSEEGVVEGIILDSVIDLATGLSYFVIDADGRKIRIGGPDAIVEDFAASKVELKEVLNNG